MRIEIDNVYFSGFWSQGDGACFTGRIGYARNCARAVRDYAPQDETLHCIADRWQAMQKRCFYSLSGTVRQSGRYQHEYCTDFDLSDNRGMYRDLPDGIEEEAKEIARDFMRWIYRALEREYEHQQAAQYAFAWQQLADEIEQARNSARQLIRDMKAARNSGISAAKSICDALRAQLRGLITDCSEKREEREQLSDNFHFYENNRAISIGEFAKIYI
jgi:hypothetical protein